MKRFSNFDLVFGLVLTIAGPLGLGGCGDDGGSVTPPAPPPPDTSIGKASHWLTTGDQSQRLSKQGDISIYATEATTLPVITVDPGTLYQEIEGFGAALTGSAAFVINRLSSAQRNALLQDLFNPETGIGISALRLTIGASDFSLKNFTYDDMPPGQTDYPLSNFSLEEDEKDVIPVLNLINSISPDVTLIASPWTPPPWMKTNDSFNGGSLKAEAYDVYSNYFLKYINGMKDHGIVIDAVTLQNEPLYEAPYASMHMSPDEQRIFIINNVGPLFAANSIATKILLYDHNWDNANYAITILNDATAKGYVAGSAFHAYGGNVLAMGGVHDAHPDKDLYFTEISGGDWAPNFSDNLKWNMTNIFIGTTRNWSKTALMWNLALDENDGPRNNGCNGCRGVVTIQSGTGNVTKNVEYYMIGHLSKFIRNGSHRIGSAVSGTLPGIEHVAFKNIDGKKVIVILNSGSSPQSFVVKEAQQQFTVYMPAEAVRTIVW